MPKWFGPSLDGGKKCVPRTWQAWAVTALMTGAFLLVCFFRPEPLGSSQWYRAIAMISVITVYLLVAWATYDPDL